MKDENIQNIIDAMELMGMHNDESDSKDDLLRFTSDHGIVTYFESWEKVIEWIEGTVFKDSDIEADVEELLHGKEDKPESIKVLIVEPMHTPYVKTISTELKSLQNEVGGMIEPVYPFDDNVALIVNEEGKLSGLPMNRGLVDEDGNLYDILAGTFIVVGLTEDDFTSLTDKQIETYMEYYRMPQIFVRYDDKLHAVEVEAMKPVGTYDIYQLKDNLADRNLKFASYRTATMDGNTISRNNYDHVYTGQMYNGETLESVYEKFNMHHPTDFRGHSLSVSDVIVINKDGQAQSWYVDSFGFKQLPNFNAQNPLQKVEELLEDDYGMIDGIINNGSKNEKKDTKSIMGTLREKTELIKENRECIGKSNESKECIEIC